MNRISIGETTNFLGKPIKDFVVFGCLFCVQTHHLYIMTNKNLNLSNILITYHQILFENILFMHGIDSLPKPCAPSKKS
jgi:hypothetical protein